jgi:hypothetical protein
MEQRRQKYELCRELKHGSFRDNYGTEPGLVHQSCKGTLVVRTQGHLNLHPSVRGSARVDEGARHRIRPEDDAALTAVARAGIREALKRLYRAGRRIMRS